MKNIPVNWMETNLENVLAKIVGGGTPSKTSQSFFKGIIPFMTVKDMKVRFPTDTIDHISDEAILASATTLLPADTLIVATRMSLGKIARPTIPIAINQDLKALFPINGIVKTYIEYFWRSKSSYIQELGTGTTVKGIRLDDIRKLKIPVAPLEEQKRIADKLDVVLARVDVCRERLNGAQRILKRFRQSVLAVATSGELTTDCRKITAQSINQVESYITSTFGKLGVVSGGITKNAGRAELVLKKPYLRVANVHSNHLKLNDVTEIGLTENEFKKTVLVDGDILIVEGNGSLEHIGRAAIWNSEIEDCVHQNHIIRWRAGPSILPKFALFCLMSPAGRERIIEVASSTTGLHTLSVSKISALPLPEPSIDEQTEIVRRVEALFAFADRLEARLATARAATERLTPALLAKAFRGELVPQDPNDEPASELLKRLAAQREAATKRAAKTAAL